MSQMVVITRDNDIFIMLNTENNFHEHCNVDSIYLCMSGGYIRYLIIITFAFQLLLLLLLYLFPITRRISC